MKNGQIDLFYKDVTLKQILEDLDTEEFYEASDAITVAEMLESFARECREQASKISALEDSD